MPAELQVCLRKMQEKMYWSQIVFQRLISHLQELQIMFMQVVSLDIAEQIQIPVQMWLTTVAITARSLLKMAVVQVVFLVQWQIEMLQSRIPQIMERL